LLRRKGAQETGDAHLRELFSTEWLWHWGCRKKCPEGLHKLVKRHPYKETGQHGKALLQNY
jgi:hypothetical protein